jgi:hypothetical protein
MSFDASSVSAVKGRCDHMNVMPSARQATGKALGEARSTVDVRCKGVTSQDNLELFRHQAS